MAGMTSNGNQQEEPTGSQAEEISPGIAPEALAGDSDNGTTSEIVDVDQILTEMGDLDPADATGPAARVAELLGAALDREGR